MTNATGRFYTLLVWEKFSPYYWGILSPSLSCTQTRSTDDLWISSVMIFRPYCKKFCHRWNPSATVQNFVTDGFYLWFFFVEIHRWYVDVDKKIVIRMEKHTDKIHSWSVDLSLRTIRKEKQHRQDSQMICGQASTIRTEKVHVTDEKFSYHLWILSVHTIRKGISANRTLNSLTPMDV